MDNNEEPQEFASQELTILGSYTFVETGAFSHITSKGTGQTLCGRRKVATGLWHEIAATTLRVTLVCQRCERIWYTRHPGVVPSEGPSDG